MFKMNQLKLFSRQNLNPTFEIKRILRLVLSASNLSRDQVVDRMNDLSSREGIKGSISKATLDSWTKDSDPARLPSITQLILFCSIMETTEPMRPIIATLGGELLGPEDLKVFKYGKAEIEKKKAMKRARRALEEIE